jgi:broad specificity phosphatase PhoE
MLSRSLLRVLLLLGLLGTASASRTYAQATIFVSRHADREGTEPDPVLTAKGRCQAEALAEMLADAKITRIFTTDMVRTQQTAAPTAKRFGLSPVVVAQEDFDGLIARIKAAAKPGETMLVVGHRGTVPRIVKALSGVEIPPLASGEYSRLVVVTLFPEGRPSVITLRQGAKCEP